MNQGDEVKNKRGALGHPGRKGGSLWEGGACAETSRRRSRGGILQTDGTKGLRQEQVSSQFSWSNGSCFPATLCFWRKKQITSCCIQRSHLIPENYVSQSSDITEPIPLIWRGLQQWEKKNLSTIGIGEQWLFASKMHPSSTFQGLLGSHLFPAGSSFAPMALTFRIITLS